MKALREKVELQKTVDTWQNSSKNLFKLIYSSMSSTSKIGLGYGIKSNDEVLSYEEEINCFIFNNTAEDYIGKPLYSRFTKSSDYKGVPNPLNDDYTPREQADIDDSLYVPGKKGPQIPDADVSDKTTSVDNEPVSNPVPKDQTKQVPKPNQRIDPSYAKHVKSPRKPSSPQEPPKTKDTPVWNNVNRINHSNKFAPRSVMFNSDRLNFNTGKSSVNSVNSHVNTIRPNISSGSVNINSGRPNINSVRSNVNTGKPNVNSGSFNFNSARLKRPVSTKPSNRFCSERPQDHPLRNMMNQGIFDSRCSGHMTCNKDQLADFEEFNGGSITFGGSKGYITSKGRIRVGDLDFESVSFVKELRHFNLFSISQICDKQHKILFTETKCLVVTFDFKMPDENQVLLKVPRQHNMYSFNMKTPSSKGYACLIANATTDESNM
ncbi:hypothetical protein Tco_0853384 [Tanacetum coccineum]